MHPYFIDLQDGILRAHLTELEWRVAHVEAINNSFFSQVS